MKKSCQKIQSLIPQLVEGELDEPLRATVLEHTARCFTCAQQLHFQRRLIETIGADPSPPSPAVYFEGVLAQIHRQLPAAPRWPQRIRRFRLQRQTMATAFVAMLFFIWGASLFGPQVSSGLFSFNSSTPPEVIVAETSEVVLASTAALNKAIIPPDQPVLATTGGPWIKSWSIANEESNTFTMPRWLHRELELNDLRMEAGFFTLNARPMGKDK